MTAVVAELGCFGIITATITTRHCIAPSIGTSHLPIGSSAILTAEDVRTATHRAAIGLPVVLPAKDVRVRVDAVPVRQAIVLSTEDVRSRLDGAPLWMLDEEVRR